MYIKRFYRAIAFVCILVVSFVGAQPQELLKSTDVTRLMQQIFDQHVDKKAMDKTILKNAFRIYIDQFDPYRMYLLDSEVQPYLQLDDAHMNALIQQYKYNDFSAFSTLNQVIQKSIVRERALREQLEKDKADLFNASAQSLRSDKEDWQDPDLKLTFAKSPDELKMRIKKHFQQFIAEEKKRFGDTKVLQNEDKTLFIYDAYLQNQENTYLFTDAHGTPLAPAQEQNLFVLHVLKALASSLDAHTTFYNNAEAYDMKVRLEKEFEGIGVALQQEADGYITINKVLEGGPAAKSGLVQPDDKILSIDGKSIKGLALQDVMEMIRGEKGSAISLVLLRKVSDGTGQVDKEVQVSLKREPITVNEDRATPSFEKFGDGIIGKVTLNSFYQGENSITSENDVRNAIKELSKKGHLRGLILDLRENSGGFLTQAVKVAGLFITNGVVVISKYSNGHEHFYRDMEGKITYNGPLIVLVSKATASAAEIVAQALQDYGVAVIVGDEHTYGKGTIQSQTVTDDSASSYFKVTVGKYYTVSGKTPQIAGVKSDIVVPGPFSEEHIGERYLENALPSDTIKPEYKDDLSDVDSSLKPWFLRYYLPTIQHKKDFWTTVLPNLQKNSAYRIEHNKNYQAFLRELKGLKPEPSDDDETAHEQNGKKNFGAEDLQMLEAVNIMKDMIMLQPTAHNNAYADKFTGALSDIKK